MFTRREPGVTLPIELGAEFIHGLAPATLGWLARSNTAVVDAHGERFTLRDGKAEPADNLFEQMKRGLDSVGRPRKDLPFAEFLDRVANRKLSPAARQLARQLVEGFDAADATRVSTLATLDEWNGSSAADAPSFRPLGGYASLIDGLVCALDHARVQVRLGTIVHTIHMATAARVTIEATRHGQPCRVQGKRAIITCRWVCCSCPRTRREHVRFLPDPRKQKALAGLALRTGHQGRDAFPQAVLGRDRRRPLSRRLVLPRDRSALPHVLVDCPAARLADQRLGRRPECAALSGRNETELTSAALDSLHRCSARRCGCARCSSALTSTIGKRIRFARGAYSYVIAGGTGARKALATPVKNTLFFAGEAADIQGEWARSQALCRAGCALHARYSANSAPLRRVERNST
jgi:hypothetical protein